MLKVNSQSQAGVLLGIGCHLIECVCVCVCVCVCEGGWWVVQSVYEEAVEGGVARADGVECRLQQKRACGNSSGQTSHRARGRVEMVFNMCNYVIFPLSFVSDPPIIKFE